MHNTHRYLCACVCVLFCTLDNTRTNHTHTQIGHVQMHTIHKHTHTVSYVAIIQCYDIKCLHDYVYNHAHVCQCCVILGYQHFVSCGMYVQLYTIINVKVSHYRLYFLVIVHKKMQLYKCLAQDIETLETVQKWATKLMDEPENYLKGPD